MTFKVDQHGGNLLLNGEEAIKTGEDERKEKKKSRRFSRDQLTQSFSGPSVRYWTTDNQTF